MPCSFERHVSRLYFSFGPSAGKNAILPRTVVASTSSSRDHKSFAIIGSLALPDTASHALRVPRLAVSIHASFPRSVTLAQLRFISLTVVNSREDLQNAGRQGTSPRRTRRFHAAFTALRARRRRLHAQPQPHTRRLIPRRHIRRPLRPDPCDRLASEVAASRISIVPLSPTANDSRIDQT